MAARRKRGMGLSLLGLALAIFGLIFLIKGNLPIGLTNMGAGVVFIAIGLAAARKAPPPE